VFDILIAAALTTAAVSSDLPCSDADAAHVAANYQVCAWEPPPPMGANMGSSDYRGRGSAAAFINRPDFDWRLRDEEVLLLNEIPRSVLGEEKGMFGGYVSACRAPEAAARLGAAEAGRRGDQAFDCWQFLDGEQVRRGGE
jgi:hypothetical protein